MLNISRQIYTCYNAAVTGDLPTAGVFPAGTSSAEKKKLANNSKSYTTVNLIDNVPLPGFTVAGMSRRYSNKEIQWEVIDPRGFKFLISSDNLAHFISITGITEGLIQQKCVYARHDSNISLTLVPVTSKNYAAAVENTTLLEGKISPSDVKIGDTVIMQNGQSGVYKGKFSVYTSLISNRETRDVSAYLRRHIIEIAPGKFFYGADPKMLKVTKPAEEEISKADSLAYIRSCIPDPKTYFGTDQRIAAGSYWSAERAIRHVSTYAEPKVTLRLHEITKDEALAMYPRLLSSRDAGTIIGEDKQGICWTLDFPYQSRPNMIMSCNAIEKVSDTQIILRTEKTVYSNKHISPSKEFSFSSFEKYYKIVKCIKDETYV